MALLRQSCGLPVEPDPIFSPAELRIELLFPLDETDKPRDRPLAPAVLLLFPPSFSGFGLKYEVKAFMVTYKRTVSWF